MGNSVAIAQAEAKKAMQGQQAALAQSQAQLAQLSVILGAKQEEYRMKLKTPDSTDRSIPIDTIISLKTDKSIDVSSAPSQKLTGAVEDMFGGNFLSAMRGVILGALDTVLGNNTVGEKEKSGMTVILLHSAVVRVDYYMYAYTMKSAGVVNTLTNGMCFVVTLSTVKISQVNSEAIALLSGMTAESSLGYMNRLANKFNRFAYTIKRNPTYYDTAEAVGLIKGYFGDSESLTSENITNMGTWLIETVSGTPDTPAAANVKQIEANKLLQSLASEHGITKSDEEKILEKQGELLEAMSEIYDKISVMKRSTQDSMSSRADGKRVGAVSNY